MPITTDRSAFKTRDVITDIWTCAFSQPPSFPLSSLVTLPDEDEPVFQSSFKIGILAQSTIATSALAAAQYLSLRNNSLTGPPPHVTVPLHRAKLEFNSYVYQWLDKWATSPPNVAVYKVGGLHRTADGFARIHDALPNHLFGTLRLLGLPDDATRAQVAERTLHWDAVELETEGTERGQVAIYAQRSYEEWDALPQSSAVADAPIVLTRLRAGPAKILPPIPASLMPAKCLAGLRVVELTRIIAGPVAGRTLAAHGADVLWVTSPRLPTIDYLDSDFSRGKRTIQLDLDVATDKATLLSLLRDADVFLQGYRPESLAAKGLSPEQLAEANPNLVVANMSALARKVHGREGEALTGWCRRRAA